MANTTNSQRGSRSASAELNAGLRARQALDSGDFKLARRIASQVLSDPQSPHEAKEEANIIIAATKVDRAPLIAGIVMALILAIVFIYVLNQPHPV